MARTVAYFGVFAALAIIISYIERLFPLPIPLPGVKIGLANVVVVAALYIMGVKAAFFISIIRVIVVGLLFGSVFSIAYSLSGGLLSFVLMLCFKKLRIFGVVGVSIAGGVFHNMGQVAMAALVVQSPRLLYYAPLLIAAGVVTGTLIGYAAGYTIIHIKNIRKP